MRDLFSQCMCVRTCLLIYVCVCHTQECQFALTVGTHDHVHAQKLMRHIHWWWRSRTGKKDASWQIMEDVEDSAAGPLQCTCWVLNAANGWRHSESESNEVNVQRNPRSQEENQIKCKRKKKARCRESSQARYTLWRVFTNQIYTFMFDSIAHMKCEVRHNWDMGMGHLWLNGLGIYGLMSGAFMA